MPAHLRRGHWRRVRVGPRSDWHYEMRWIPPTMINPYARRKDSVTVYRLNPPTP